MSGFEYHSMELSSGLMEDFLGTYPEIKTRRSYRSALRKYFRYVLNNKEESPVIMDESIDRYMANPEKDVVRDLQRFVVLAAQDPPLSTRNVVHTVISFLSHCDIELTKKQEKQIKAKIPKGKVRTVKKDLDRETIRTILLHLDELTTAVFLTLISSGMRIGECMQLTFSDIDIQKVPAEINIRGEYTKSGEQRITFLSDEAVRAIIAWLNIRERCLKGSANKNRGLVRSGYSKAKNPEDNQRVFPFNYTAVSKRLITALKDAGIYEMDPKTKRSRTTLHATRTFFRSQLSLGCPLEITEALMDHSGYLTSAYRRYSKIQMAEIYQKNVHHVCVYTDQNIEELEKEFDKKMQGTTELVQKVVGENLELRSKLTGLENRMLVQEQRYLVSLKEIEEKVREKSYTDSEKETPERA